MKLRLATLEDLPVLERWSREFEEGVHGEPFVAETLALFRRKPERGELLVIERSATAIGYTILVPFWSNEFRGEALIVDELYISPEHRGGNGAAALALIEDRARSRDVKLLALEVLPGAARVHALYKRAGFKAERTLYQKALTR